MMIDNEIIQEIRAARKKLWEESGQDLDRLFQVLMERQKDRPNLVDRIPELSKEPTLVEDPTSDSYNAKN